MKMPTFCYVAKDPNSPGFYAAVVDDPQHAKDTAKAVAEYIKEGAVISRVTVEDARAGLDEYLDAKKLREAAIRTDLFSEAAAK